MECPYCGQDSRVLDSRRSRDDIRRRRECLSCGRRFTTYESVAAPEIRVTKRDGSVEDFTRAKLADVIRRVTRDRPVAARTADDLVRGLEAELLDAGTQTIASWQLADRLLARLEELDPRAAARFASNYTQDDGSIRTAPTEDTAQLAFPLGGAAAETPAPGETAPSGAGAPRRRVPRARRPER